MKWFVDFGKNRFYIPVLFSIFLGLLASRRWYQFISPQVWDEDGTPNPWQTGLLSGGSNIADYISHGWLAFFEPVNDYLITIPKLISAISLGLSISSYPIVSTIIAWLFIVAVGLSIALAPTKLRGRSLCAVAVFMIPSDPEVFGLPLYTFWWASLLLFLVVLWDERDSSLGWRLGFLLFGGLSSPVIILVLPILVFRAHWYRSSRSEQWVAFIATLVAAIQCFLIAKSSASGFPPLDSVLMNIVPTFFGKFLIGNWVDNKVWLWFAGLVLMGFVALWLLRARLNVATWVLVYLLVGSIVLTVARIDPSVIHPRLAGPRYFFFPFILMFWILIQDFFTIHSTWLRGLIQIVALIVVINAAPAWSRGHDDLRWKDHVLSCRLFPEYAIPIQFDGNKASTWFLYLSGKSCTGLLRRDILVSEKEIYAHPTFPFAILQVNGSNNSMRSQIPTLVSSTMTGTDFQKSNLEGYRVIGSFSTSDADTGELLLKLRRGDHIRYRSGPGKSGQSLSILGYEQAFIMELPIAVDWVTLDFSNTQLPDEFIVKIKDEGQNWGEWSAVAIRK